MAEPRIEPFADADGDQEIGEGEAPFRGGGAVEPRDGDRHLDSGSRVTQAVTDGRSLASRHSYWTALTIDSRLAIRAG